MSAARVWKFGKTVFGLVIAVDPLLLRDDDADLAIVVGSSFPCRMLKLNAEPESVLKSGSAKYDEYT